MPSAILLYLLCLIENVYSSTPLGVQVNSFLSINFHSGMDLYAKVDTGYFYSIIFVAGGWHIATKKIELNLRRAAEVIFLGVVISCLEIIYLWKQYRILPVQSIGVVPLAIGIAMYAFSMPNIGRNSLIAKFGRYTFGIYFIHFVLVGWLKPIADLIEYPFSDIIHPFAVYFLSLLVVILLSKNKWLRPIVI